jgi:hypothetical protein
MSIIEVTAGILLVALSTSLGWGLRGVWGHWWGAMVPGALGGMAIWIAFGGTGSVWQMLLFGTVLAVGLALGGTLSTLKVVGYVRGAIPGQEGYYDWDYERSPLFGLAGVFLLGGMWGLFPGIALGLLTTEVEYGIADLALWGVLASLGAYLGYKLLVLGLDLHLSPPRSDGWAAVLGGSMATFAYFALIPADQTVLLGGVLGWLGFGFGYQAGSLLYRFCVRRELDLPSWKMGEHTIGFFGGLGLGAFAALAGELRALPIGEAGLLASAFMVLWFVPYMSINNTVEFWLRGKRLDFRTYIPKDRQDPGPTWITRRTFAVFQLIALASLLPFAYLALEMVESWPGTKGYVLPFAILILLLPVVAMAKRRFERGRRRMIVYAIFSGQALACVVLALLL